MLFEFYLKYPVAERLILCSNAASICGTGTFKRDWIDIPFVRWKWEYFTCKTWRVLPADWQLPLVGSESLAWTLEIKILWFIHGRGNKLRSSLEEWLESRLRVNSFWWYCRGPYFSFQQPHGSSQLSVTELPGIWCPLLAATCTAYK